VDQNLEAVPFEGKPNHQHKVVALLRFEKMALVEVIVRSHLRDA
jgi:hypothetical protein